MLNSSKGIAIVIDFMITSLLDHLRRHCLNPLRYLGAFIENFYCHQPPSTVTQSIGIYDHLRVSPISQSLLLILMQTQLSFKVKSSCSIVAW